MTTPKSNKTRELFAQRLRTLRREAGFKTARMFAKTLGIDENRYTRYERAEVEPDLTLIARFCETLRITPNKLLGFEDQNAASSGYAIPGFSESTQTAPSDSATTGSGPKPSRARSETDYDEAVRLAAWQLAEARARIDAARGDRVALLRRTAQLFDAIVGNPIGYVAHMAQEPEVDSASREVQDEVAMRAEALLAALRIASAA